MQTKQRGRKSDVQSNLCKFNDGNWFKNNGRSVQGVMNHNSYYDARERKMRLKAPIEVVIISYIAILYVWGYALYSVA